MTRRARSLNAVNADRRKLVMLTAGWAAAWAAPATAQVRYPNRPIRLVVPFSPGGSTDSAARAIAETMAKDLEQPIVVENRPGAGSTIAAANVAASPADGYTLYITGTISHASAAALYPSLNYDPVKSFSAVGFVTESPFILVVNSASRYRSVQDLVQAARVPPGALAYASSGNGAAPHLVTEMLGRSTGTKFLHIPYKGVGPALTALLASEVQFTVADASAVPHIAAGRLRALSVLSANPSPMLPGVPGLASAGIRDVDVSSNLGILAPAGTPTDILDKVHASLNRGLVQEDIKARLAAFGQMAAPRPRQELQRALVNDVQRYASVVRDMGIRIE